MGSLKSTSTPPSASLPNLSPSVKGFPPLISTLRSSGESSSSSSSGLSGGRPRLISSRSSVSLSSASSSFLDGFPKCFSNSLCLNSLRSSSCSSRYSGSTLGGTGMKASPVREGWASLARGSEVDRVPSGLNRGRLLKGRGNSRNV